MRISVLVVAYNCSQYIKSCLKSINRNTFTDWEIIVFDDRSNDNTLNIIKSFAENPKRQDRVAVSTHHRKMNCGAAYNYISQFAKGDIICVVDGDDVITKDALEKINMAYTKYPEIDYIYTQHFTCSENLKKMKPGISSLPVTGCDLVTSWEKRKHCFSHMRTCRKNMLQYQIFNPALKFSVDKYMGMMLESHGNGGFLNEPLYLYRTRPMQLTNKFREQRGIVKDYCLNTIRQYRIANNLTPKPIVPIYL